MSDEEPTTATLEPLLATREVVVFCGSGGVGKTTTAAAAALARPSTSAARCSCSRSIRRRRLASALGLSGFGNVERRVPDDLMRAAGPRARGELYAAMLDTKASWDDLVLRHAPDEETAYRILENRLYQNLTARFVQSHDYIAMERLYDLHATGTYDLIVVDTPPTRNAIDFLEAPERMAEFFGGRLLRWLTMPYRIGGRGARLVNVASRPFYQMADRILGSQFLQDIAEFFLNFQSMYDGFRRARERGRAAPPRPAHDVRGGDDARRRAAPRGALLLRRAHQTQLPPRRVDSEQDAPRVLAKRGRSTRGRRDRRPGAHRLPTALLRLGVPSLEDGEATRRVLTTAATTYRDYAVVATREAELRDEMSTRLPDVVTTVPGLEDDIHDLAGLRLVADRRFARHQPVISTRGDPPVSCFQDEHLLSKGVVLRHAQRLVASWQPLSDLCFSDLLLLAPVEGEDGHRFVVLAPIRPTTGQASIPADRWAPSSHEVRRRRRRPRLAAQGVDRRGETPP